MTKLVTDPALQALDLRSRDIFRRIVDSYLLDGEPVGSRNLSRMLPSSLSPATVRNVMSDLEQLGLVYAPHVSAGRLPTACRHSPSRSSASGCRHGCRRRGDRSLRPACLPPRSR